MTSTTRLSTQHGFRVSGVGFRVECSGSWVEGERFSVLVWGCGALSRVCGCCIGLQGYIERYMRVRVWSLGFRLWLYRAGLIL